MIGICRSAGMLRCVRNSRHAPSSREAGLLAKRSFQSVFDRSVKTELQFGRQNPTSHRRTWLVACSLTCGQTQSHTAKTSGGTAQPEFTLAAVTGFRAGELLGLTVVDVD